MENMVINIASKRIQSAMHVMKHCGGSIMMWECVSSVYVSLNELRAGQLWRYFESSFLTEKRNPTLDETMCFKRTMII